MYVVGEKKENTSTFCMERGAMFLKYFSILPLIHIRLIPKTCLYNFDPLKPHFYTVKLMFSGVYIIFLDEAILMSIYNLCFEQKHEKYQNFLSETFNFFGGKIFRIFDKACFRNDSQSPSACNKYPKAKFLWCKYQTRGP